MTGVLEGEAGTGSCVPDAAIAVADVVDDTGLFSEDSAVMRDVKERTVEDTFRPDDVLIELEVLKIEKFAVVCTLLVGKVAIEL